MATSPITPTPSAASAQLAQEAALIAAGNKAGAVASSAAYNQAPPAPAIPTNPPASSTPAPQAAPPMPTGATAGPTGASANTPAFTSTAPAATTPQQAALTWYQGIMNGSTQLNPSDPNTQTYLQTLSQMGVAGVSNLQYGLQNGMNTAGYNTLMRAQQNYADAQGQISDRISNAYSNIQNILANGQNTPQQQAAVQAQIAGIQGYLNVAANYGIPLTGIAYQDANGNWIAGSSPTSQMAALPTQAVGPTGTNPNAVPAGTPGGPSANPGTNNGTAPSTTSVPPAGTTAPPAPEGNGSTALAGGGTSTPITPAAGANASGSAITLADAGGPAGSSAPTTSAPYKPGPSWPSTTRNWWPTRTPS